MSCYLYNNKKFDSKESLVDFIYNEREFLKTSQGDVYGFVDPNGTIYIDPELANTNTLLHEGAHIQMRVLRTAAAKGDTKAQAVLDKIRSITSPIVDRLVVNSPTITQYGVNDVDMQAERGITRKVPELTALADSNIELIKNYDRYQRIKKKQAEGVRVLKTDQQFLQNNPHLSTDPIINLGTPSDILKSVGITRPIEMSLTNLRTHIVGKPTHEITTLDLVDIMRGIHNPALVNKARDGKVQLLINQKNSNGAPIVVILNNDYKLKSGDRVANITTAYSLTNSLKVVPNTPGDVLYVNRKKLAEFLSDFSESINRGFGKSLLVYPEYDSLTDTIKYQQSNIDSENEFDSTNIRKIIENTKNIINKTNVRHVDFQIMGEQGAQGVQQYAEATPTNLPISTVYQQRQNETDAQYRNRLEEEVFARLVGDNAEQYLKDLGLNKQQVKSFLDRIKEFIEFFIDWLKSKPGFRDLSDTEIEQLSIKEFLTRSTSSMLLGEFKNERGESRVLIDKVTDPTVREFFGENVRSIIVDGSRVGTFIVEEIDGLPNVVRAINIIEEERQKGIAKKAYLQYVRENGEILSGQFYEEGNEVNSFFSEDAKRLWDSLKRDYNVEIISLYNYKRYKLSLKNNPELQQPQTAQINATEQEPQQIKSATDNIGTFDPQNNDIRFNIEQNETRINRLPPTAERGRIEGGRANVEATIIAREISRKYSKSERSSASNKEEQAEAIKQYAKDSGIWFEEGHNFGQAVGRGNESTIYMKTAKSKNVTKIINPHAHSIDMLEFFDRVSIHNGLFPDTALTIEGFTEEFRQETGNKGDIRVVMTQRAIDFRQPLTMEQIREFLESLGFEYVNDYLYKSDYYILDDTHEENIVLGTDGRIYVLDLNYYLNTPDDDYGGVQRFRDEVLPSWGVEQIFEPNITPTTIESQTYKQLLSIPGITKEEALTMYKHLYSQDTIDWENLDNLSCEL